MKFKKGQLVQCVWKQILQCSSLNFIYKDYKQLLKGVNGSKNIISQAPLPSNATFYIEEIRKKKYPKLEYKIIINGTEYPYDERIFRVVSEIFVE